MSLLVQEDLIALGIKITQFHRRTQDPVYMGMVHGLVMGVHHHYTNEKRDVADVNNTPASLLCHQQISSRLSLCRTCKRSYHQRLFHDDFLKACTRIFWKLEPEGTFARQHLEILQCNNWTHISEEVLVNTSRHFGKTISVSMFAAAMLYAVPNVEISIYSTCKHK